MSHQDPQNPWPRLTAAARRAADDRPLTAPHGFATRIAALAMAQEQRVLSLFELFAFRAVAMSCLLAVVGVAVNYPHLTLPTNATASTIVEEEPVVTDDALATVLESGN